MKSEGSLRDLLLLLSSSCSSPSSSTGRFFLEALLFPRFPVWLPPRAEDDGEEVFVDAFSVDIDPDDVF